jgi:hypothetical protein
MQPGDLVRVRNFHVLAGDCGKVGVIVNRRHGVPLAYDVLMDGGIRLFYGVHLEAVDEAG